MIKDVVTEEISRKNFMIQSKNRDVASRRRRRPNLQKQTDGICMVAFSSSHVLFLLILSLLGFLKLN